MRPRGFAKLPPDERHALARKGGRASVASGRAHRWGPEEARAMGQRGGRPPGVIVKYVRTKGGSLRRVRREVAR